MNGKNPSQCVFKYYKEFLDVGCRPGVDGQVGCIPGATPGTTVNLPPVPVDCLAPGLWRNTQCLGGDPSASLIRGTEYDWMNFYYGLTVATDAVGLVDQINIYRNACGGACVFNEDVVTWAGLFEGAQSHFGINDSRAIAFDLLGDMFGVSDQL
jgi:hypothetical protein